MTDVSPDLCFLDTRTVDAAPSYVTRSPYRSRWSLKPLLESTEILAESEREWLEGLEERLERLSDGPDCGAPLDEAAARELVRFFFPPFKRSFRLGALMRPLFDGVLLVTPDWRDLLTSGDLSFGMGRRNHTPAVRAGMLILNQCYGQVLREDFGEVLDYRDAQTGLVSHLAIMPGFDYVEVIVEGSRPHLSQGEIRELLGNPDDEALWLSRLPPEVFSFRGFEINHVVDNTIPESQSQLQQLLLKREAVLSERRMAQITEVLRNSLRVPDLRVGIMALDYPRERAVGHRYLIRQDILAEEVEEILDPAYGETIYREACAHGTVRIYDDLRDCRADNGPLDEMIIAQGYYSLVLVPLFGKGEHVIGMLELASATPYAFNNLVLYQLESITPLFRQAIRRSRDDMEARLQAVMRQTFTAIDPSIEWRFVQAAAEIVEAEQAGVATSPEADGDALEGSVPLIEPIRFEDVWALYAQADIVGSSNLRNQAIGEDLLTELAAARELLADPAIELRYPLAGKLIYDIDELTGRIEHGLSPNDEQAVLEFMQYSFEPTLEQFRHHDQLRGRVEAFEGAVAAARPGGMSRREAYERSVRKVTSVVNGVITAAQREAQRFVPHYFSKYRTDGIEFNIYAGQSLLQTGVFSEEVHLQNLRLWQLQTMVNVTKAAAGIRDRLEVEMSTAQLILAFGNQITLQFRMDEKRFDVEGSYNVRYEVIKKRIDKALIRGTEERLTIADHVAIVYSHHSDRRIYHDLVDYLHGTGEVVGEVEDLELEPMQGVDGLYGLRVRVL